MTGGGKSQNPLVLFGAYSKLAPDSSVCFLIIYSYYVKSRDIRGLSAHFYCVYNKYAKLLSRVPITHFFLSLDCHVFARPPVPEPISVNQPLTIHHQR